MRTLVHIDDKTQRVNMIHFESDTFEEERILGILAEALLTGESTITVDLRGEVVCEFKMVKPTDEDA